MNEADMRVARMVRNELMKRDYAKGVPVPEIARRNRLGLAYVRKLIGVQTVRGSDERNKTIYLKFKAGKRQCDLAREYQVSRERVRQIIKKEAKREQWRKARKIG